MSRTRDESKVAEAARLAGEGKTRAEIAAKLGVSEASVKRWLKRPVGRPRLPDGAGSRSTRWRQGQRGGGGHATGAAEGRGQGDVGAAGAVPQANGRGPDSARGPGR